MHSLTLSSLILANLKMASAIINALLNRSSKAMKAAIPYTTYMTSTMTWSLAGRLEVCCGEGRVMLGSTVVVWV